MQRLPVLSASVNGLWRTKMFRTLAIMIIVAIAVTFITTRFMKAGSAHLDGSSGPAPNATAQGGCCANQPNTLRRMIGSFYNTEDNFVSTLTLNNKGPNVIAVTPVLHGENGQTFTAAQVLVNGESSLNVSLNAIANNAGSHFKSGSFEFTYQGRMMEMGGGLRIVNAANSLIFDEQMLEPGMKFSSPQLEAVYAIPSDKAEVSVIITNTTTQSVTVNGDATFVGANGHHSINGTLSPNETSVVNLPKGLVQQSSTGAVSITHNGAKGALLAMIHIWDKDKGFSSAVNFADPAQGKTTQLHGTGLRLGSINNSILKPVIAVRNIGTVATTVTARVPYAKQNGSTAIITLPQTSLAAGETKLLNTTNPGLGQTDIATAGVEINYTGAPGSVIATIHSASLDGNQVFTVPMKDPQGGMSSTGGYPWFIDGTASTVVFIKNTTTEDQKFHVTVYYEGGKWGSNLKTLSAGQTYLLDLKKVRDTQEKGSEDNVIPANASSGHVAWSMRGGQNKVLIGRAQTVDLTNALASTYECQCYCGTGYAYSYMIPNSASGFIGNSQYFTTYEVDSTCFSGQTAPYAVSGFFSSNDSSVATVNSSSGLATCVGIGSTYINNSFEAGTWNWIVYGAECEWVPFTANNSASCAVIDIEIRRNGVVINNTAVDVIVGQKIDLATVITGTNSAPTAQSWEVPGIKVAGYTADGTSAVVTQLTNTTSSGILFHWVDGSDGRVVKYTATIDGKTKTVQVTFNVKRPTATLTATTPGTIQIQSIQENNQNYRFLTFGWDTVEGIHFSRTVEMPAGFTGGDIAWVQTVVPLRRRQLVNGSWQKLTSVQGVPVIDTSFPYSLGGDESDSPLTSLDPLPTIPNDPQCNQKTVADSFEMYLFFKPNIAGSIWVPLRKVAWNWSAGATRNVSINIWTLNAGSAHSMNPASSDSTTHPVWSSNVDSLIFMNEN